MKVLAIFGAGGQGIEILELAKNVNKCEKRWDDFVFINNGDPADDIYGVKVMGLDEALLKYKGQLEGVLAVGEPTLRDKIAKEMDDNGIPGAIIVHPAVAIPDSSTLGAGTCVFPGAYVSTNSTVGRNVMISVNAVIGHDAVIEDNVILSVASFVAGMVHVGKNAYIGGGAQVKESINIGENSVVAIGSVVFRDVAAGDMVLGNPARATKRSSDRLFHGQ